MLEVVVSKQSRRRGPERAFALWLRDDDETVDGKNASWHSYMTISKQLGKVPKRHFES